MPNPNAGFLFAFLLLKKPPFYAFFLLSVTPNINQRLDWLRLSCCVAFAMLALVPNCGQASSIQPTRKCEGGPSDGSLCTSNDDCPGGICVTLSGGGTGEFEQLCCTINGVNCGAPEGQTCEEACPECYCDPCPEVDNEWSINLAQPYESRITAYVRPEGTCDCLPMYQYRCKAKYFGTDDFGNAVSSIMIPTCTICPVPKDALYVPEGEIVLPSETGVTSDPGSPDVTYCYVKSGFSFEDSLGVYMFTNDCNYTE